MSDWWIVCAIGNWAVVVATVMVDVVQWAEVPILGPLAPSTMLTGGVVSLPWWVALPCSVGAFL